MYHYVGCGLDNVQLRNGYEFRRTHSGTEVIHIENVSGLHRALAQWVCNLARPLSPKEFKFLRKELDMSQRQVAMMAAIDEQTVSLWERGQSPINQAAERLLRVLMMEHISGNAEVQAALQRFCAMDRALREQEETSVELEVAPDWRIAA